MARPPYPFPGRDILCSAARSAFFQALEHSVGCLIQITLPLRCVRATFSDYDEEFELHCNCNRTIGRSKRQLQPVLYSYHTRSSVKQRSLQPSCLSSSPFKSSSLQRSRSLSETSRSSSQQHQSSTKSQGSLSNPPASIPRMADNDATIAELPAQVAYLLAEKAARDAEDKKDEKAAGNPHEVVLVESSELTKQVKEIKHALARSQGNQILDLSPSRPPPPPPFPDDRDSSAISHYERDSSAFFVSPYKTPT
ncbi:hypothetical protein RHMOL_Rhmol01G0154000 [Rhododendron molle]|uniref:Uncharacterized protein n=1 Tax=Rhododendron molle TaxID=49168 RepID=A0ACC0Q3P4_RHOML|nr:hypothetical protein RHMOL_Rhmol01G0154000 [Rhododendron molle]